MLKPPVVCIKYSIIVFFFLSAVFNIAAQNTVLPDVKTLTEKAFMQKTFEGVRQVFDANIAALPDKKSQCQALTILAEYERQHDNNHEAVKRYAQAAELCAEQGSVLLLEAVRTLLCGGDSETAKRYLKKIKKRIQSTEDDPVFRTVAVYEAWILLAENHADRATAIIKSYLQKKIFADYHPALLFTLWWVNNDENAQKQLIRDFPTSLEAAAVQGTVTVLPSLFWYLMPKTQSSSVTAGESANNSSDIKTEPSKNITRPSVESNKVTKHQPKPLYYQLGFYKTKKYAENLAADLRKKNFTPLIKEEKRPSGTVYFVVLVEENTAGTIGLLLKNAGYETFPIFP